MRGYAIKAAREAKAHTNWIDPDTGYEEAVKSFLDSILTESPDNRFLPGFLDFQKQVDYWGFLKSLAQIQVRLTAPGIPDTYQGTELWDLSLVDPDNRRPVNFPNRQALLQELENRLRDDKLALCVELLDHWSDGRVKLYVTTTLLRFRQAQPELFTRGDYLPLEAQGTKSGDLFAFARRLGNTWAVSIAPRLVTNQGPRPDKPPVGGKQLPKAKNWKANTILLPSGAPARWTDCFTGTGLNSDAKHLPVAQIFQSFPVALLISGQ